MYGLVIFVSGFVGFAQVGLDTLAWKEGGVEVVDWLFTGVTGFVGGLWVGITFLGVRRIVEGDLESAERERESLLVDPVAENQYGSTDYP